MVHPSYIVAGGGRTGSHWIEQVVHFITDYPLNFSFPTKDDHFVFHTHGIQGLINAPTKIKNSCCLIFSKRKDIFSQAISLSVATHTDEWFVYTDKEVGLFNIDPNEFLALVNSCHIWNQNFDKLVRPLYSTVLDIDYDDLLSNIDQIEDYMAQKIGMTNFIMPDTQRSRPWASSRNPRNYQKIVENWHDLWDAYQNHKISAH